MVRRYLRRLSRAARELPRQPRSRLIDQISEHLNQALGPNASEAQALTELDRLGSPDEIVAAERDRLGLPERRFGGLETFTLIALVLGSVVPLLGTLAAFVGLWSSRFWTRRDKIVATAIVPLTCGVLLLTGYLIIWEAVFFSVLGGPPLAALYLLVFGGRTKHPARTQ